MYSSEDHRPVLGIDGCRGGWFVVRIVGARCSFALFSRIEEVALTHAGAVRALIDIPIGLPETEPRICDRLARQRLGPRRHSVFPVPCREAAHATDYATACDANLLRLNRSLSRQSWNLCAKIAEVDRYLCRGGILPLIEAHPELAFCSLKGEPPRYPKRHPHGRAERIEIINPLFSGAGALLAEAGRAFPRRLLQPDDILDALVLAISARLPLESLPSRPARDGCGLTMRIVRPRIA